MANLRHWNMKTASSSSVIMPAADLSRLMLSRPHMTMLQVMKPTCKQAACEAGVRALKFPS